MGGEAGDTKDVSTLETRRALWQQWVCGCKACSCACERVRRYVWREVAASGSRTRSEEQTGEQSESPARDERETGERVHDCRGATRVRRAERRAPVRTRRKMISR